MSEPLPDAPSFITRYRWRLRLGTAITIVIVGATVFTAWYSLLRAPGPRSVCDHLARLRRHFPEQSQQLEAAVASRSAGGNGSAIEHGSDQLCTWYFTAAQKERGFLSYGQLARCVRSAESPPEVYSCL